LKVIISFIGNIGSSFAPSNKDGEWIVSAIHFNPSPLGKDGMGEYALFKKKKEMKAAGL